PGAVLPVKVPHVLQGVAWAGENGVAKVELSIDDGKTWFPPFQGPAKCDPFKHATWLTNFIPQQKGPLKILARCTDDKGNTQPDKRDADRRTYVINHPIPVEVTVK